MDLRLKRTPGIYVVGFMGCGKSTVGRLLAGALGWPFADLDEDIERAQGRTISDIFAQLGEPEFRRIEHETLAARMRQVEKGQPVVLALGGGAFAQEANRALLRDHGVSLWLDCPLESLKTRVARAAHRPLARDPEKFETLYRERLPFYQQADIRVPVDDHPPSRHVETILSLPLFR